ncbi:ABC transporter ATP-binding protein [Sporichthya sp.]|uniref:ABC transporter ATP-binding protein n=1 Tax=Sporichthya sp. TaxID=65475 RepID=UPI00183C6798|nr:ABC transporter ATP-binding protein [Sporichthya sp.]MBA3745539.1 ABC transporter ATP-binding protein [Sporichthya sp.]
MLSLREVHAGYGGTRVLHDVTLHVPAGSIVALLGANGAGKTTVLRVAAGLVSPTAGALVVDGTDVTGWAPNALVGKGVCHVPEGRGVFPSLTVRENLVVQCKRGEEEKTYEAAASIFPVLGRRLDQVAGTLSGGEQQMLALMRAYIQNPRTVLLDEVSMGLAPIVVDEIFEFLRTIAAGGASLLLVEQYVTKALALSDFVYLLHKGQVAFAGEPGELDGEDLFARYLGHAA